MKRYKYFVLGFIGAAAIISLTFTTTLNAQTGYDQGEESKQSRLESLAKFTKVLGIVEKYNVDDLTLEQLMNKAIQGMMTNIDPHSAYLNQQSFENLKIQTSGEFGGLGITVGIKDGALTVIAPIEGTPADKVGLKAGDIILKIDENSTLNMTIDEAVGLMRGKPKTPIDLTIVRKGERKPLSFHIVRDIIKIESVYTKQIGKDILYIRVTNFDKKVVADVRAALKKHLPKDKGVILDLRNNPGGLLDQAVGLANLFIKNGVIVSQKGRDKAEEKVYSAKSSQAVAPKIPMVVLVNGGSASASEIVSGALQDHNRAVIIGENTFGKGSVQVILPISEDEAIKLTVARYYLPSGRTIQAVGISPDVEVGPGKVPQIEDDFLIKEADLKKHLQSELDKIDDVNGTKKKEPKKENQKKNFITNEQIKNDMQLKEAIDILRALIITSKGD